VNVEVGFPVPPSRMDESTFVERFGAVYEHSPWIARDTWRRGLGSAGDTVAGLARAMAATVRDAGRERQLALIRAHPDLAVRVAVGHSLTRDSRDEQAGAGLDRCTADEYRRFGKLNEHYKARFGFPFVMAVRGRSRHDILAAFEQRLDNDPESEFRTALEQIHHIARLRLETMASANHSPNGCHP
jgi:OHCU decarboxylase